MGWVWVCSSTRKDYSVTHTPPRLFPRTSQAFQINQMGWNFTCNKHINTEVELIFSLHFSGWYTWETGKKKPKTPPKKPNQPPNCNVLPKYFDNVCYRETGGSSVLAVRWARAPWHTETAPLFLLLLLHSCAVGFTPESCRLKDWNF